jgi:hypothetical protein
MSSVNRRAGVIYLRKNGVLLEAKGSFSHNINPFKRETILSTMGVSGYKETPQALFIEGELTDSKDLDLQLLYSGDNDTITLEEANGKTVVLRNAWYAGDGTVGTEDGNVSVRWEGISAEEIK